MEKKNAAKAAGLIWIVLLLLVAMQGVATTAQAETVIIPNGDCTITENGVYQLPENYTGIITIASGVSEATVSDAVYQAHHDNTSIFVEGGRTAALALTIEDLDIGAGAEKAGIDFGSAGMYDNKLYISGTCNVTGGDNPGICVPYGAALVIDKVLNDANDRLTATGGVSSAGIGSYKDDSGMITIKCGVIIINGGTITANGGAGGAGIGGSNGTTIINDGTITANGGMGGAGIGGSGGTITINGGTVAASGSVNEWSAGSGIGGGSSEPGGIITITGGTVIANGKGYNAGIGGGIGRGDTAITISGGVVNATANTRPNDHAGAAGIGSGPFNKTGISITISGGVVTANGSFGRMGGGAGIGSGSCGADTTIIISGGEVTANAGNGGLAGGSGIGGGVASAGGTITISGGVITANAGYCGAGIGGGFHSASESFPNSGACGNITITGTPFINATGDAANGAENIGKGTDGPDTGTLKDNAGTDLSYLKFRTSGVPGAKIKLNGSEYTTNAQGISGIFVPRNGNADYTVSKAVYEAVRGDQAVLLRNYEFNIPMVADNTASSINDVTPLLLQKGTSLDATFNNDYGIYGALYLVPKAGLDYIGKEALDGVTNKRTTVVNSPATSGSIDTTDLAQGTYQVYLVDSAENVSAPSADIIVDNLPEITDCVKAADDAYVDLALSEGIYGAADGASKLSKDKLQLIFTPHGGTAADAEIISVKQNNGTEEVAASELQGGEDVVRVFIEAAGISSGVETIEIKPADGSSIFDIAGNAMSEAQTTGVMLLKDSQAPTVSNGNIRISNTTRTGTTLTWNKASDLATTQAELKYCIYQSTEDNINTAADIEANGTVKQDYTSDIGTLNITGLQPGGTYYFNVIVRDNAGNRTCYNSASAFTMATSSGGSNDGNDTNTTAEANEITIPASVFTGDASKTTEIKTELAALALPLNMLTGEAVENTTSVTLIISKVDIAKLSSEVQAQIGNRPVIELALKLDGETISWNNPDAAVTVSIPYTPTAAELANPESIVIWYIDGSGNAVCVPNGHYDPATGTVTFSTTHFSYYAVGYNDVGFNDVPAGAWYYRPVRFIAARGITTGTGEGNFSPDAKLTRGQFIVMLMNAYGINPDANLTNNFSDVGNTYYTGYLAAAKRLGISSGVGNNMFAPEKEITRQEMFTLLYNALKVIGQLPQGDSSKTLSDFTDAGEISSWAKDAMMLLVKTGTVGGSDGKLTPTSTTTRAEMAQVLYNLLSK